MFKVSILLPIRNEEKSIKTCLEAIINQQGLNNETEVIIADGLSTDNTIKIICAIQKNNPNIKIVENPGKIVPTGLNAALLNSQGEIIVRVDGHTIIAPDYIQECVDALQRTEADNVGGKMTAENKTWFGRGVAAATSSPFGVGGARFHYSDKEEWVDTVYLGAWRREVFYRIGLFDEEMVRDQDDEFNYRLRAHGGRILLTPRIKSKYTARSTPRALWKQYFEYGFWKVRVLQKHPRQMRYRQFIPPAFVFSVLALGLSGLFSPFVAVLFGLVMGGYFMANIAASLLTASRHGWKYFPVLPLIFATLHLSYGSGFLLGLIHFLNRWGDKQGKVPRITAADV